MRKIFHPILHEFMKKDKRIWVILPDLGYKMFDRIFEDFPDRIYNTGAAEQCAMTVAIGLAEEGLIPVVYSIVPFLLKRPFEMIDLYVNHESVPVKLLGAGRYDNGKECYGEDGQSHAARGDKAILALWPNVAGFWPDTVEDLPAVTEQWLYNDRPSYLNLKR